MIKLNIGCGPYPISGYINIDKNPVWTPDLVLDVREGLTYEENSVDEIHAHHFIEHLDKDELIFFLGECYKKLKLNGILDLLYPVGITHDLDHKSFLWEDTFDRILGAGTEGKRDEYSYGPKIIFELVSKNKSKNKNYDMFRIVCRKVKGVQ